MRIFLTLNIIFLFSITGLAQQSACTPSKIKKAQSYFKDAQSLYQKRDFDKARTLIQKAIDEDPEFADAYLLAGYLALKKRDYNSAQPMIEKAVELCETIDPEAYFILGRMEYDNKKYADAEKHLNKFLAFDKINEEHGKKADTLIARAKLYEHPVPFDPKPVEGISTRDPEYFPYISPDNEQAFFTRRYEQAQKGLITSTSVEKFMFAQRTNGVFDKGKPMDDPFNKQASNNEGGATITVDNNHLFFTVNKGGNFDIYSSDRDQYGNWSDPESLGSDINDPKQWDSQPSVTPDGNTLYFASARDSLTGIDIYVIRKDENGNWTKARKLPFPINTTGDDKSPYVHGDGKTLYFSSDSLMGLGGYDIFMSKLGADGKWSTPVNLGYPINTDGDEVGFFVSTDGKTAYFASNKINGNFDIFSFDLYPKVRPERVYLQRGELKANKEDSLINATIEIKNTVTKEMTKVNVDSVSGKYAFVVNFNNDLILTVKKDGYAFESEYISAKDTTNDLPVIKNMMLERIEVGKPYTINDIYFTTNSYDINDTTKIVMNEFSDYLKQNPRLHVAIQGHTDNVGTDMDNLILSGHRAKTIYEYLISRGIDKSKLSYHGFGATKPIASNATEEGRAKNRRTIFVVTAQ